jgi:hypothetical protein
VSAVGAIIDIPGGAFYRAEAAYVPILRELGLTDGMSVFEHPDIVAWRSLPDRENCTLDAAIADGRAVRLHVKRWRAGRATRPQGPADEEAGILLLKKAGIVSVPFAAAGVLPDGRGFVITEDLTALGYDDTEKLIERGRVKFDDVSDALADVAAKLHKANLRHRDMYLCHFFVKVDEPAKDVRLIDAARVSPRPKWFGRRWVIKDLAQFWYSTTSLPITDAQRDAWLRRYCELTGDDYGRTRAAVVRKASAVARHDAKLKRKQPTRNVSIPRTTGEASV